MKKCYKLTDENGRTNNSMQWGENITRAVTGSGTVLCTNGFIHFYMNPLIAALMNPAHGHFKNPILWECKYDESTSLHEPLKSGSKTVKTIKRIPLPQVTATQRVAFGILCAMRVHKEKEFTKWAKDWLSGKDRSRKAAAAYAAYAAYVAYAAANAAAGYAANAANYAVSAADAAANAADYAANAADYSTVTTIKINFVSIAKKALTIN